jgi:hypothetical protein
VAIQNFFIFWLSSQKEQGAHGCCFIGLLFCVWLISSANAFLKCSANLLKQSRFGIHK